MRRLTILTLVGIAAAILLLGSLCMNASADDSPTKRTATERSRVADRDDNAEGERWRSEENMRIEQRMKKALSTSSVGLVEVRSRRPGGGMKVDLEGRFRQIMVATVNENGELSVVCTSGPGSLPEKPEPSEQPPAPEPVKE
jgi:hypothetical protein